MHGKTPFCLNYSYNLIIENISTKSLVDLALVGRNLKDNLLASELVVHRLERLELVVDESGVLGVEEDLLDSGAANLVLDSLANDLGGENQILEESLVHLGQGSRHGSRLRGEELSALLGQNSSLSKEDNVSVGELLLELSGESLLDLVHGGEGGDGHKDDQSLLSGRNLELSSRLELEQLELGLEVGGGVLEVHKGLGDLELELGGVLLGDLEGGRHIVCGFVSFGLGGESWTLA